MAAAALKSELERLRTATAARAPESPAPAGPPPAADDAAVLASEIAATFGEIVEGYREHYKISADEAAAKADECDPDHLRRRMECPPEEVSWFALHFLGRSDPELALRWLEEVKQEARAELRSGHRAGRVLEGAVHSCWGRAQFLALRAELAEAWRPRDAQEWLLIGQMAQFQTLMERWQQTLTESALLGGAGPRPRGRPAGPVEAPRVSEAEAAEQAAAMVERFQRLHLRALKALQDRRRGGPPVVVRRAGQVNVGAQQVNVCGGA
jgi:hypothetical protein